jgi:hypothetical protein
VLSETDRERCRSEVPALDAKAPMQFVACHFPEVRADIASGEDAGITGATAMPDGSAAMRDGSADERDGSADESGTGATAL